eukprot:1158444-Pelagomonas_calceolata.AAC.2
MTPALHMKKCVGARVSPMVSHGGKAMTSVPEIARSPTEFWWQQYSEDKPTHGTHAPWDRCFSGEEPSNSTSSSLIALSCTLQGRQLVAAVVEDCRHVHRIQQRAHT